MRDFNEKQIKELIKLDAMAARQMVIKDEELTGHLRIARELIEKMNLDAESWGETVKTWKTFCEVGNQINQSMDLVSHALEVQAGAKSADEMLTAGFSFEKIQIGKVSFICGEAGLYEREYFSHMDDESLPF